MGSNPQAPNGLGQAARDSAAFPIVLGSQPIITQTLPLFGHRPMNVFAQCLTSFDPLFVALVSGTITSLLLCSLVARKIAPFAWLLYSLWTISLSALAFSVDMYSAFQYLLYGISGIALTAITWKCKP